MAFDDSSRIERRTNGAAFPAVAALRIIPLEQPSIPQRRTSPRRRLVEAVAFDRRRRDRRNAKPGIDGLLRMVLADDWQ